MGRLTQSFKQLSSGNNWPQLKSVSRRTAHGGIAWVTETNLLQPQDGASVDTPRIVNISPRFQNSGMLLNEPEDAELTGGTRSLLRRVLGLNVSIPKPLKTSATPTAKSVKRERPMVVANRVA